MATDIRNKWEAAYKKAAFYSTEKNTKEYWDSIARADEGSLSGDEHINLILDLDRAPDFCVAAALVQAIDLFMSAPEIATGLQELGLTVDK